MQVKDYYSILQLKPSATLSEIKKAYRVLAQKYHPDKNNNDPYASVQFAEIKEAYEVLTNPLKKQYYLQQRWYYQSKGRKFNDDSAITPPSVLKQCLELSKYVATLDKYRMNKEGLSDYILQLIPDSVILQLKIFKETSVDKSIIDCLLKLAALLPYSNSKIIYDQLLKLAGEDMISKTAITDFLQRQQKKEKSEKLRPLIIVIITIILSILIYFVSH